MFASRSCPRPLSVRFCTNRAVTPIWPLAWQSGRQRSRRLIVWLTRNRHLHLQNVNRATARTAGTSRALALRSEISRPARPSTTFLSHHAPQRSAQSVSQSDPSWLRDVTAVTGVTSLISLDFWRNVGHSSRRNRRCRWCSARHDAGFAAGLSKPAGRAQSARPVEGPLSADRPRFFRPISIERRVRIRSELTNKPQKKRLVVTSRCSTKRIPTADMLFAHYSQPSNSLGYSFCHLPGPRLKVQCFVSFLQLKLKS
jgi:hypothetical protein